MKILKRIIAVITVIAIIAVIGFFAILRINRPAEEIVELPLPAVETSTPRIGSIELLTALTGTIEAADSVYIIPKGTGEVMEVYVSLGDYVEKGQKLFKIDNESQIEALKISLDQLQLSINDAQTNVDRMSSLYAYGDISSQTYEQALSALNQAKLQYDSAKISYDTQVENSIVTAPISGILEQFSVDVHDMVAGSSVGVISGLGNKIVSFSVTEKIMNNLNIADEITIEKNGIRYTGNITEIGTMVEASTGLFKIKAALDMANALPTGTMVKVRVTSEHAENVMIIPIDCVNYYNGDAFVYVYNPDDTVSQRQIEQGLIDSDKVQVLSGLDWSDNVVITWSKEIYDGAGVRLATEKSWYFSEEETETPFEETEEE